MIRILLMCGQLNEGTGQFFGVPETPFGGWINGTIDGLRQFSDVQINYVSFEKDSINHAEHRVINGINYDRIQYKNSSILEQFFTHYSYDVYHLFGTENEFVNDIRPFLDFNRVLISIQGISSECESHYYADCQKYFPVSLLFREYLKLNCHDFVRRGKQERVILKQAKHIANRTAWGSEVCRKLGFKGTDHYLNETIRAPFYGSEMWSVNQMKRHSIYISQGNYPIKAAHMAAEMVIMLRNEFPDVRCYIGGEDITRSTSLATKLGVSYASFIKQIISDNGLEEQLIYTGPLDCNQVISHLLSCNVSLLPSSIENSPNSLQEAMKLGVPCVASNVGGIPSLVENSSQCLLYPFDEAETGARLVSNIFQDDNLALLLSKEGKKRADILTNQEKNGRMLYDIYTSIKGINGEES